MLPVSISARGLRLATLAVLAGVAVLVGASGVEAQVPTGAVSGQVHDGTGLPLSGAEVIASSPNLQGVRKVNTTQNGGYLIPLLPPGEYSLRVAYPGFGTVSRSVSVAAAESVAVNVVLWPEGLSEQVTVTANTDAFVQTAESATNLRGDWLSQLPTMRTIPEAVNLAPGVHATGPQQQPTVAGAFAYENLYLLNGVEIQDNIRRDPFDLYIPDAIQETTVATSGISAEYGRFAGGVINAITKSGGNRFSGSLRESFTNDNWRTTSPFGEPKVDDVVPTFEGTLGGPIAQDRLWFFAAARHFERDRANETTFTRVPYTSNTSEQRVEVKGTLNLADGHRLQSSLTSIRRQESNVTTETVMDLRSLVSRELPQTLFTANYTGALSNNFFVEAQVSARRFAFKNDGALTRDLIDGTVLQDQLTGARWWSPSYCGICSPEQRNSMDLRLSGVYFMSTPWGSHNLTFGYDAFDDVRKGDLNQSGSDYHIWTMSLIEDDEVYPVASADGNTWIVWWPVTQASQGTSFRTHSLFLNDQWQVNNHWSFNLGLRMDRNRGRNAVRDLVSTGTAWSPRLGVVWDPSGTGTWSVTGSAGRYVSALANSIADSSSPAGIPSILGFFYEGPDINVDPDAPLVSTREAVETMLGWYTAQGGADGLDPFVVILPGVDRQIRGSLDSPYANEFTVGINRLIGRRGAVRADVVWRTYHNFYAERVDASTGVVENDNGEVFDLTLIENTDAVSREYLGLHTQVDYRPSTRTQVGVNYTLSQLRGNFDGENAGTGPLTASVLSYPEYFDRSWSFPLGDLTADQRHRLRLWAIMDVFSPRAVGDLSVGILQHVDSGTPYGARGSVRTLGLADDPGYILPPDTVSYYFTPRDAFRTETMFRTDLSLNYTRPAGSMQFFADMHLLNVFNQFQAFNRGSINTTVLTAVDDPNQFATFDPFTEQPVEGVHWGRGPKFGQPTSAKAYTTPRAWQFSLGIRF